MRINVFPILAILMLAIALLIAVSYPLGSLLTVIFTGAAITFAILSLKE